MEIPHQTATTTRTVQCNSCMETLPMNSSRCSECKMAHYCSQKCQADDWTRKHGLECIGMKTQREEAEKRAVSRLNRASALSPRAMEGRVLLDRVFNMENDEGHLRRLRRFRETAGNVVEPGTVLRLTDRRVYGVGPAVDPVTGESYLVTMAGYTQMRGKYSFLQDSDGNVFRRRYLVARSDTLENTQFDPSVWWESYDRQKKTWLPLTPKGTDPETTGKWEIYIP